MRQYLGWASVLAAFGALALWMKRTYRPAHIDPHSLGTLSSEWFNDHRHQF